MNEQVSRKDYFVNRETAIVNERTHNGLLTTHPNNPVGPQRHRNTEKNDAVQLRVVCRILTGLEDLSGLSSPSFVSFAQVRVFTNQIPAGE